MDDFIIIKETKNNHTSQKTPNSLYATIKPTKKKEKKTSPSRLSRMSYQVSQVWKMLDSPPATLKRSQTTRPGYPGVDADHSHRDSEDDSSRLKPSKSTSALLSVPDASASAASSSDDGDTDVEEEASSRTASAISSLMSLSSMVTSGLSYATTNPTAALAYTSESVLSTASMLTSTTTESTLFLVHFALSILDLLRGKVVEELCMAVLSLLERLVQLLRLEQMNTVIVSILALLKTSEMMDMLDSLRRVLAALFAVLRTEEIRQFRNRVWKTLQFVRKIAGKETDKGSSKKRRAQNTDDGAHKRSGEKDRKQKKQSVSKHDKKTGTRSSVTSSPTKPTASSSASSSVTRGVRMGSSSGSVGRRQSWISSMLGSVYGDDLGASNESEDDDYKGDSGVRTSDEDYGFETVQTGRMRREKNQRRRQGHSISPVPPGLGLEGGSDGFSDSSAAAAASLADWIKLLKYIDNLENAGLISMAEGLQFRALASTKDDQLFVLFATYCKNESRFLRHARSLLDWNSVTSAVAAAPADGLAVGGAGSLGRIGGDIIDPSAVGAVPAPEGAAAASSDGPAYFETDMLANLIDEMDSD